MFIVSYQHNNFTSDYYSLGKTNFLFLLHVIRNSDL